METRSQAPPKSLIGRQIAIHAAKRPFDFSEVNWHIEQALDAHCTGANHCCPPMADAPLCTGKCLPYGAVVATAVLKMAGQVTFVPRAGWARQVRLRRFGMRTVAYHVFNADHFGDYSLGRWIWFLEDIEPVDPPVAANGKQGVWEVNL